jgi:NADPH-dependent 2,4-dienoyl-CoA reductase/sulfur reductase-like enzyme
MRIDGGTVVVVGGGPAGMEAARVAAGRGYRVVLFEKEDVLGGKFVHSPNFPAGGELSHVPAFLAPAVERAGVDIRLGTEATVDLVLGENPHAVIVAAGAQPFAPEVPGDGSVPVIAPWRPEDIARIPDGGENIVMMDEDGYFWGSAIAEAAMARAGKARRLTIASRFFETFRELPMVSRIASLRALDKGGAKLLTSMTVDRIQDGRVVFKHYLSGREEFVRDVAAVLWVGRQEARSKIFDDLKKAGMDRTRIIGDAYAPRRLPIAMLEAHSTAKTI